MPAASLTRFTLSTLCGSAIIGSMAARLYECSDLYSASASAHTGSYAVLGTPAAARYFSVTASDGNTAIFAPISMPMFATTNRSSTESDAMSPWYSTAS